MSTYNILILLTVTFDSKYNFIGHC